MQGQPQGIGDDRGGGGKSELHFWDYLTQYPFSCSRPKGTMVTYGGMAKQPVTVPVVSTPSLVSCSPLHVPIPSVLGAPGSPRVHIETLQPF